MTYHRLFCFSFVVGLLAIAGCGGGGGQQVIQPNGTDPLPLAVGNRWTMEYDEHRGFGTSDRIYDVAGTTNVDGETGYVMRRSYGSGNDETVYLHSDSEVRRQSYNNTFVQILQLPLQVGDEWTQTDQIVDTGYDVDGNGHNEVETTLETVKVDRVETVTTPAGTFVGAIVVSSASDWEFKDPVSGTVYDFSTSRTSEWYVPGIGLVRREINGIPGGGIRTYSWSELLKSYSVAPAPR